MVKWLGTMITIHTFTLFMKAWLSWCFYSPSNLLNVYHLKVYCTDRLDFSSTAGDILGVKCLLCHIHILQGVVMFTFYIYLLNSNQSL